MAGKSAIFFSQCTLSLKRHFLIKTLAAASTYGRVVPDLTISVAKAPTATAIHQQSIDYPMGDAASC
jgi:hypothetical protein